MLGIYIAWIIVYLADLKGYIILEIYFYDKYELFYFASILSLLEKMDICLSKKKKKALPRVAH